MAVHALTIDFWNTMVVARTNGRRRQSQRLDYLLGVVQSRRPEATEETVRQAYRAAANRWDTAWKQHHAMPTASELLRTIWDLLDLDVEDAQHREAVCVVEEGVLFGPPVFAEGLEEALAWAAARYRLGIISDTMFSPGRVAGDALPEFERTLEPTAMMFFAQASGRELRF